ncbi:uncharacterized protein LOC126900834 isoform X2 [Daktulosphaira vitifoliae]|uniref:uncharacterized protein LOC126900834 isoform X2 n=1 Tax=Daktulosphaira vitifoliae TaxID=58002 RepID=UPI0021AAA531|nr:uncharacterized protein LOC126900834 isoform X2 [Daktulosphaira vitifoliae]
MSLTNSKKSEYISIHLINDWYILRSKYRILGNLVGSLSSTPRQEEQNGLPSLLMPEEARIIVENSIGRIVKYSSKIFNKEEIKVQEELDNFEIRKIYAENKAHMISELVKSVILCDDYDKNGEKIVKLKREISNIKPYDASSKVLIHLFDNEGLEATNAELPEIKTDHEKLRYKVFKDLWTKGFYLTCGIKFGGDFLVYNGDPLTYHAQYIVNCNNMDFQSIICGSRIGSITNKKMVIAQNVGTDIQYSILYFEKSKVKTKETLQLNMHNY